MSTYYNLAKLGRTKLPSGTYYALIDVDGRAMITENYSSAASYSTGDLVVGTGFAVDGPNASFNDCLLKAKTDIAAGAFDSTQWEVVTVASELSRLEDLMSGGVHYVGKTTTKLIDGDRTNPIVIGGSSYTAKAGDMVIFDWSSSEIYQTDMAYSVGTYLVHIIQTPRKVFHGITNADITAARNTSWDSISDWVDILTSEPEFIFDGTIWNAIGHTTALGDLAFKDKVTGYYWEITSATVDVKTPLAYSGKMGQTTIVGVGGTESVSKMTAGTAKDVAKAGTAVRYGTADVGTPVRYGTANVAATATVYGKANVGTEIEVGTSLVGTTQFNTNAIRDAVLTGTKTFNTDAIKSASLIGTKTFATTGVTTSVDGDCLILNPAGTGTVGIETAAASTATVGIETTPANTAPIGLGLTKITPAVDAPDTQTIYGAVSAPENQTIAPAVAAPNNQTIVPAVANGSITPWSETAKTVATAAASATTVGTGTIDLISGTGSEVLTGLSSTTETKTVTLNKSKTGIVESK